MSSKNIYKKNYVVANDLSHKLAKTQFEIFFILDYTKMKTCGSVYAYFKSQNFNRFFFCSLLYKEFHINFIRL
jgi:hypothetical protein